MREPKVILAAEVVTALGLGVEAVWSRMMAGTCGIRPLSRFPRGRYATDLGAEVPPEDARELGCDDHSHLAFSLALGVARRVVDQAADAVRAVPRERVGLILSTTKAEIGALEARVLRHESRPDPRFNPFDLARDVAEALDLHGPVCAVSNACASGLVAVAQAARLLDRGEADLVAVVGVDVLAEFVLSGFSALKALSSRPCRPFDRDRDGITLGEGAGALLVGRPEERWNLPGGRPLGLLRGWGVANDAWHVTAPSPTGEGLKRAIARALAMAGMPPDAVDAVNAHGTGTRYSDLMEAIALRAFLPESTPVFSVKGYFGHTSGAAGVIEAALCLAALRERTVPGCLGLEHPDPDIHLRVRPDPVVLPRLDSILTVKSGFGGVNAAAVLGTT